MMMAVSVTVWVCTAPCSADESGLAPLSDTFHPDTGQIALPLPFIVFHICLCVEICQCCMLISEEDITTYCFSCL